MEGREKMHHHHMAILNLEAEYLITGRAIWNALYFSLSSSWYPIMQRQDHDSLLTKMHIIYSPHAHAQ